ncbi:MAG: glycosyltransferase, partial [Bacteroidota bacterium]|nr:glycosyltransferase [Bacteroidota bacterium]
KNIEKNNTNNKCLFIDQISVDMIPSYVRLADALFLSLKCNDLFSKTVPAKLQTYMSLSKPIIANIQGESADIIKQSRTGFIDETKDQSNLADIIKQIINMDQNELDLLGKRANKFYEKNYHSKLRKSQLLELII